MRQLEHEIDALAERTGFSGVVRIDGGDVEVAKAYGLAHRGFWIPNTADTRFAIASGTKGLTALTVMSLVERGRLRLTTAARSMLGDDLPLIDDDVTVEHLLAHRSGIGDYFDEELGRPITDYVLPVPVHELSSMEEYLRVLDGYPQKFRAGERFSYCNSGYVVLALLAERSSGAPFHRLVRDLVCEPAAIRDTGFLRSDELPGRTARGYLESDGLRTNVFHLPVVGGGDGGVYTTVSDVALLWTAMLAGRIVSPASVSDMVRPHSDESADGVRYGLGFWVHDSDGAVELHGYDAGVSFRSVHAPREHTTRTVVSNTSEGAWAMSELLDGVLG